MWSPAAILAWLGVMLPTIMLAGVLRRRRMGGRQARQQRVALVLGLMLWAALALLFMAGDLVMRRLPHALPMGAHAFMPYQGFVWLHEGNPFLADDPELGVVHRPGTRMAGTVYFGNLGDLVGLRLVAEPAEELPGYRLVSDRRFGDNGFAAEFGPQKPGDPTPEVAFLGDSYVVGYGVPAPQTWPGVMMARLRDEGLLRAGQQVHDPLLLAWHFAVGGFSPLQALGALRREAPGARPRVVVLMYFEGNDVGDAGRLGCTSVRRQPIGTAPWKAAVSLRPLSVLESSPLHTLLAWAFAPTDFRLEPHVRSRPWLLFEDDPRSEVLRQEPMLRGVGNRMPWLAGPEWKPLEPLRAVIAGLEQPIALNPWELADATRPRPDWPKAFPGWPCIEEALDELARYAHGTGAYPLLVIAPSRLRVYHEHLSFEQLGRPEVDELARQTDVRALLREARRLGSWKPLISERVDYQSALVEAAARARGLDVLDLAPGLRAAVDDDPELLYFPFDTHWSIRGHRTVAELIVSHLIQNQAFTR